MAKVAAKVKSPSASKRPEANSRLFESIQHRLAKRVSTETISDIKKLFVRGGPIEKIFHQAAAWRRLRPELQGFAQLMERRMSEKDKIEPGWNEGVYPSYIWHGDIREMTLRLSNSSDPLVAAEIAILAMKRISYEKERGT